MAINNYVNGQAVRVFGVFTLPSGLFFDPTNVFLEVQPPNENVRLYEFAQELKFVRESKGVYRFDILTDKVGIWRYKIYSTGEGQAAERGTFNVTE